MTTAIIAEEEIETKKNALLEAYEEEYKKAKFSDEYAQSKREWLASNWQGVAIASHIGARSRPHNMTGASKDLLQIVGNAMCYAALEKRGSVVPSTRRENICI